YLCFSFCSHLSILITFFSSCSRHHSDLHSFPTRRSSDLYYDDVTSPAAGQRIEADVAFSDKVQQEDGEICERVQRGLTSRAYDKDRKSTRLNSSHLVISYAVFCLKKKKKKQK